MSDKSDYTHESQKPVADQVWPVYSLAKSNPIFEIQVRAARIHDHFSKFETGEERILRCAQIREDSTAIVNLCMKLISTHSERRKELTAAIEAIKNIKI